MAMAVNPAIFRAYDIRGLVDIDLTDTALRTIGQAAGTLFREWGAHTLAVGRDARLSSPRFQAALIDGLRSTGINVVDIGEVPTPVMYFAVEYLHVDGGIVISASHNPPQYNGVKLRRSNAVYGSEPLTSDDIQALERIANGGQFLQGTGTLTSTSVNDAYIQESARLLSLPSGARPRVVIDGGNGVAGPLGVRLLEAIGAEVIPLYIEPDGTFPNHHPDPLKPENLQDLMRLVREHGADMGIGLDGDGDRLGVVADDGKIIWADRYLIVLARYLLGQRPGPVVFDVKCSSVLPDAIREFGGVPVMWKTGYLNLSNKMRETSAVLGGELSGHTIAPFPGHYYDDGAFAGALLLSALYHLGEGGKPLSLNAALAPYPELPSLDEGRIHVPDAYKFKLVDYVRERFAGRYPIIDIDGIRVDFGDGWGLVRASNTEPAITTRFEAHTAPRAQAIRAMMLEAVEEFRQHMPADEA
ncbi:MAG: phosphomannomutase/phosphoglucomutase [Chloroflexaceae bacterium]|nr:phosphomannomutase/phosphoglucomutase [Chloroflexaceae bacterium]NJO06357.1 phosphomannomutase/phosphoglucomutase [Chloroflexaceae bacterium]